MPPIRVSRLWLVAATLILTGLIIALAQGSLRESVVIPILTLFWLMQRVFESLPQALVWGALVILIFILAIRSLPVPPDRLRRHAPEPLPRGRVEEWAIKLVRARADPYVRWQIANRLAQTTIRALATDAQVDPRIIRRHLESGELDVPPQVQRYLLAGLNAYEPPQRGLLRFLPLARTGEPLDTDLAAILPHLEKLLV